MTVKETILDAVKRMDERVTYDEAIEKLFFLQKLERALKQADEGNLMDHDEFMDQLLSEDEEILGEVERGGPRGPQRNPKDHRTKGAAKGQRVRKQTKKVRR